MLGGVAYLQNLDQLRFPAVHGALQLVPEPLRLHGALALGLLLRHRVELEPDSPLLLEPRLRLRAVSEPEDRACIAKSPLTDPRVSSAGRFEARTSHSSTAREWMCARALNRGRGTDCKKLSGGLRFEYWEWVIYSGRVDPSFLSHRASIPLQRMADLTGEGPRTTTGAFIWDRRRPRTVAESRARRVFIWDRSRRHGAPG